MDQAEMDECYSDEDEPEQKLVEENPYTPSFVERGVVWDELGHIFDRPEEPIEWLVEELLALGSFSIFSAPPKAGKSTLIRNLARCVADGEPFLDRKVRQGRVLYLGMEDHPNGIRAHFKSMGVQNPENIIIATSIEPVKKFDTRPPHLHGKTLTFAERWLVVTGAVAKYDADLVILDPYWMFMETKDINDYTEVNEGFKRVRYEARGMCCHIAFTHHSPKQKYDNTSHNSLGSTGMTGNPETCITLALDETRRRHSISSVNRWGRPISPPCKLTMDDRGRIDLGESVLRGGQTNAANREDEILRHIDEQPGLLTRDEIYSRVGGKHAEFHGLLTRLIADGKIRGKGTGKRGDPFRFERIPDPTPEKA